ncbi:MAG: hypothetical protein Q9205_000317 [Flavoplaca limonia]
MEESLVWSARLNLTPDRRPFSAQASSTRPILPIHSQTLLTSPALSSRSLALTLAFISTTAHVISELPDANPAFRRIASVVQCCLCRQTIKRNRHKHGNASGIASEGHDSAAGIDDRVCHDYNDCNFDSISRQREAEGSSDATTEGDLGEGGAGKEVSMTAVGREDLVSGHVRTIQAA